MRRKPGGQGLYHSIACGARAGSSWRILHNDVRFSRQGITTGSDYFDYVPIGEGHVGGTIGVLEGDRGLSMAITLIPQSEKLAPGDAVITSGIEPGIRRGLAVGTIEKVNRATQDPFQSADVIPFRSLSHPVFVQVLLASEQP